MSTIVGSNKSGYATTLKRSIPPGSPPRQEGAVAKRLKLKMELPAKPKSFTETIAAAMDKRTEAQSKMAAAMVAARELEVAAQQVQANARKDEAASRSKEVVILAREKRHNEIMAEARLLVDLGTSKEDVMAYIQTQKLGLDMTFQEV